MSREAFLAPTYSNYHRELIVSGLVDCRPNAIVKIYKLVGWQALIGLRKQCHVNLKEQIGVVISGQQKSDAHGTVGPEGVQQRLQHMMTVKLKVVLVARMTFAAGLQASEGIEREGEGLGTSVDLDLYPRPDQLLIH